jgi:hypothetical protein
MSANGPWPALAAPPGYPWQGAAPQPQSAAWPPLNSIQAQPIGCICPPGANLTCERDNCPRQARSLGVERRAVPSDATGAKEPQRSRLPDWMRRWWENAP